MKLFYLSGYAVVRILGVLPFRLLYALGYLLGMLYWQLGKRDRRIACANIRHCFPHLSDAEQTAMARASLIHTAINFIESTWIWAHRYPAIEKKIVQMEGLELLREAEAASSGTVFVLAHFGQWELFGDLFGHYCEQPVYLGREFGVPLLDNYIKRGRERSGGTIFPCTRDGLTQLYTATANGRATGILADQKPARKHGLYAPLFGQPALTSLLVQDIVKKTGARVVMTSAQRLPRGRGFKVTFFPPEPDIYAEDLATATAALNRSYEQLIQPAPEQYTWNYKRFGSPPKGQPRIY